jgi:HAD superfamily hydrolase (TIGR01509 family)
MNNPTKLVVFDLDGVLIDSKELHFESLNRALREISPEFEITPDEHSAKFDGLSTRKKLEILNQEKGLKFENFEQIWKVKQEITLRMLRDIKTDKALVEFLQFLQEKELKLALASNSVKKTVLTILKNLGIDQYFSLVLSNEDVIYPKPHPEIYWKAMIHFGALPENTFVFEDSYVGRLAAQRSGVRLIPVDSRTDLTWGKIKLADSSSHVFKESLQPWKSESLNVLIPMAGAGSRFETAGYTFPKPLIEVRGKPMIQVVVENLNIDARFIYIVQKSHYEKYNLEYLLRLISPRCTIVQVEGVTEGAACTTLLAREFIDNNDSLVIANSDQFIEWNSSETLYSFMANGIDGGMVTFNATHPKWSYVKIDDNGIVMQVAEKIPISNLATVGIYFWKKGSDYVNYADQMIKKDIRTNGEFYVCPVFNQAIEDGKKFKVRNVENMWGLGTPEDLNQFLQK